MAARDNCLAVVLDFTGERVALELKNAKLGHSREDVQAGGVLELVVLRRRARGAQGMAWRGAVKGL